jgi:hypothetical protein
MIQIDMFDTNATATLLKVEIDALKKEISEKNLLILKKTEELKRCCNHPEISHLSQYHEGGYLNSDYTENWTVCKICGTESDHRIKQHGHYS